MAIYHAHSRPYDSPFPETSKEDWHLLRDHLQAVGEEAARRASCWEGGEEARLAGLLHDLGKYACNFQRRLEGKAQGIDHWSVGAYWAAMQGAHIAAFAIYGHHVGLHSPAIMQTLLEKAKDPGVSWNITEYPAGIKLYCPT
jgi:CRISPR-associated endonuclease Cas3-HD